MCCIGNGIWKIKKEKTKTNATKAPIDNDTTELHGLRERKRV